MSFCFGFFFLSEFEPKYACIVIGRSYRKIRFWNEYCFRQPQQATDLEEFTCDVLSHAFITLAMVDTLMLSAIFKYWLLCYRSHFFGF